MLIESAVYGRSGACRFSFETMEKSSIQNDDLLAPWLQTLRTRGDEEAAAELEGLIETHIEPVIKGVIRFKLRLDSGARADEADLAQEALTQWLAELRKFAQPDERLISDARGLAATIAYRVCYGWLRRQSPRRRALSNRLQYALTRQAGLALWTDRRNFSVAGLEVWRGQAQASSGKLRQLPDDEKFLALVSRKSAEWQGAKLNDLLAAIFDYVGGPVAFDDLVGVVAALLRVKDEPSASTEDETGGLDIASGPTWRGRSRSASFSNGSGRKCANCRARSGWPCSSICARPTDAVVWRSFRRPASPLYGRSQTRSNSPPNGSPNCGRDCRSTTRQSPGCSN